AAIGARCGDRSASSRPAPPPADPGAARSTAGAIVRILPVRPMSDPKPDPLSDVIRGLGLILRAAKTTVERVPTKGLEDAVIQTAREVGRAIENVAETVEREVLGRQRGSAPPPGESDRDDHERHERQEPDEQAGDRREPRDPKP
ncbi:MAG: hypothetical protein ACRENE_13735, partial [Polyangiaceae bacterium]